MIDDAADEIVTDQNAETETVAIQPVDIHSFVEDMPALADELDDSVENRVALVAGENAVTGILLQQIIEGALLAAGKPLTLVDIAALFEEHERPAVEAMRAALVAIDECYRGRGFELREVASGYRFQVIQNVAPWIARLWEEKPQRYSRALLETLALIAYRQPITRGDIEDIRGVAVASNIMKTLLEREWVRIVGHKDVPGRPAMFATTRKFLDYFNLKNLEDLPALSEIRDLDTLNAELSWEGADTPPMVTAADLGQVDIAIDKDEADRLAGSNLADGDLAAADVASNDLFSETNMSADAGSSGEVNDSAAVVESHHEVAVVPAEETTDSTTGDEPEAI